jgi:hypothetical protein
VAAHVVELAEGMVQAMVMTRTQAVFAVVLVAGLLGAGVLGIAAATGGGKPTATQSKPDEKAPDGKEDVAALRRQSKENLTKLGTAMHEYHAVHDRFPPPALSDKDGKPLLSWRVLILPYLGHKDLYRQFKLDEPWDSPDNKKLLDKMPAVFAPVRGASRGRPVTYYQVFAGKGTMFEGTEGIRLRDITDGTVATVMMVEAAAPVPWTKPDDLAYAAERPVPKLGGLFKEGFHLVTGDGFCRFVKKDVDEKLLHALITRNGEELVDLDALGR